MKFFNLKTTGRLIALAGLILGLSACDSSSSDIGNDEVTDEIVAAVSFVASDVQMSPDEVAALEKAFAKHEGDAREPGFLWKVAAELQQSMSEEQIQRLLNRLDHRGNIFGRPGFDHGHGGGFGDRFHDRPGFRRFAGAPAAGAFADALGLTEDQRVAIAALHVQFRLNMNDLRVQHQDGTLTDEAFRQALEDLAATLKSDWQALLTDDQNALLDQLKQDRQDAIEERKAEIEAHRAAAREVMISILALTDTQQLALEELHADVQELRGAFQELIDSGASREEVKAWAEDASSQVTDELTSILDQTQLEIFVIHGMLESRAGHRFRHLQRMRRANG